MNESRQPATIEVKESQAVMSEPRRGSYWSGWSRTAFSGAAIGLTLLLSSSSARMATSTGIDPLEILNLQVRPNILLVLDSSGSMGEGAFTGINIANEHPDSKIMGAKNVLQTFITDNQTSVSFMFGQYTQPTDALLLQNRTRWIYAASDADEVNAAGMAVVPTQFTDAAANFPRLRRRNSVDAAGGAWNILGEGTGPIRTLQSSRFYNRQRVYVLADGTYCGIAASLEPAEAQAFVIIEHKNACADGSGNGTAAKFKFSGVDGWSKIATQIVSSAVSNPGQVTTATPHGFVDGDNVTIAGHTGSTPSINNVFVVDVISPTVFALNGVDITVGGTGGTAGAGLSALTCGGFKVLTDIAACTDNNQIFGIGPFLELEHNVDVDGNVLRNSGLNVIEDSAGPIPLGVTTQVPLAPLTASEQPDIRGIRAAGNTPVANTLLDFKEIFSGAGVAGDGQNLWYTGRPNVTAISTQTPVKQRTFAIVVTDGDDTCATSTGGVTGGTGDNDALRAAHKAQLLYQRISSTDPASGVPTFIVAFGSGVTPARANWEAYGGSGMVRSTTAYANDERWDTAPTATDVAACSTCRPAYIASDSAQLAAALKDAISLAVDFGEFSASGSIVGTVFELTVDATSTTTVVESPLDPTTRYNQRINILYQPTFEMPAWQGHLFAFRNDGTFQAAPSVNSLGIWEAGQTLFDRVSFYMQSNSRAGRVNDEFTFAELHAGEDVNTISSGSTQALIRRRIFTSARNGVFPRSTSGSTDNAEFDQSQTAGRNVVALWPPKQTSLTSGVSEIDDPNPSVPGPLDSALGIAALTFLDAPGPPLVPGLVSEFQACLASVDGGPAPAACDFVGNPALATQRAQKEAREMLIAWAAGAQVKKGTDGLPLRTSLSESTPSELLYQSRGWLLLDSTLATPALASPPLRFTPSTHVAEFILYRDGRRDTSGQGIEEVSKGFGLRNPDFDDANPETKLDLKPVMSTVYLAANDMLHAFRAGPQCGGGSCPGIGEQGSEEMWGFIPYDQLGKLRSLRQGQKTKPHTYVIASSVRVATIFIPDSDGYVYDGVTYTGHWRTVLYFGRGPGGNYYTSLDVTGPGDFTKNALDTNPPWVLWSRGNVDTNDGATVALGGTANGTSADEVLYRDMGQSWSVPAIGNVDPAATCDDGSTAEWRLFTGSGYGNAGTDEGKRFYQLNAISGDICESSLIPGRSNFADGIPDNALVAGPSAYNPRAQDAPATSTPDPKDMVTRVYFPDLHGRIWRYTAASGNLLHDAGANQPFGSSLALLKISGVPSVFGEAGNDARVPDSDGPFNMYGVQDPAADTAFTPGGTLMTGFPIAFPSPPPSNTAFRGTVQPTTAFNTSGQPRIFFAGTRFNPPGVVDCLSSFDTIIFAVSGIDGGAVYDFDSTPGLDLYTIIQGNKTTGIQAIGGGLLIGDSGSLASVPTPTPNPSPTPTPGAPRPAYIIATNQKLQSPVCRSR